jgi:hypothetical protein
MGAFTQGAGRVKGYTTRETRTHLEKISTLVTIQEDNCLPVQSIKSSVFQDQQYNVAFTTSFVNVKVGVEARDFEIPSICP